MSMNYGRRTTPGVFGSFKRLLGRFSSGQNLWDNARFLFAEVPVHPDEASRRLPCGLKLADPPRATLFLADYTKTSFSATYHEAALLVHVRHLFGTGVHCPWMIVDDDTALIYGRELLGYPKKMGAFTFEESEREVRASVSRRGVQVLSLAGLKGEAQPNPAPAFDVKTFNVGGPGSFFLFQPIWMFRPREAIRESRRVDVRVEVQPSEFDPIADLIEGEPVSGRFVVMDILGSRYNLPVGLCGVRYLETNFNLRFT